MTVLPALPTDVALDTLADPGQYVVLACERAKTWLADALEHGDIDRIVELKSQAEAIRVYTAQKQLGKDAELSAAEIVRRAERGIGLAIKRGQDEGTIRSPDHAGGPKSDYERNGRVVHVAHPAGCDNRMSPSDFGIPRDELARGSYVMREADDDRFDEIIEEAKAEGNLSRANVVRKVKGEPAPPTTIDRLRKAQEMAAAGYTSRQIGEAIGVADMTGFRKRHNLDVPADAVVGKTRHLDSDRIVGETVIGLEATVMALDLVDMAVLDRDQIEMWATSLSNSLRSLNRFHKQLKEMTP